MATEKTDVVIVGVGAAGGILAGAPLLAAVPLGPGDALLAPALGAVAREVGNGEDFA